MKELKLEQNSIEWFEARLGLLTASNFGKLLTATGKVSKGKTVDTLIHQLASERITRESEDTFDGSYWTERGKELEPKAFMAFSLVTNLTPKKAGLCLHESEEFGCSPDGLLEGSGLEIKCPSGKKHLEYLEAGALPEEYKAQVMGSILVTGFNNWWFMSYHPNFSQQLIINVERDEEYIANLAEAISIANNKIKELTIKYQL